MKCLVALKYQIWFPAEGWFGGAKLSFINAIHRWIASSRRERSMGFKFPSTLADIPEKLRPSINDT